MAEQTDLLEGLLDAEAESVEAARDQPEWAELAIEGRRYRWRVWWSEVDREHWRPENRVGREGDGPYRPPPRGAFELEYWTEDYGWRPVRFAGRRDQVWGMVRSEAMEAMNTNGTRDG